MPIDLLHHLKQTSLQNAWGPIICNDGMRCAHEKDMACRRREQQTAKLRKTAEKMLMAQLRKHALTQASKHGAEGETQLICIAACQDSDVQMNLWLACREGNQGPGGPRPSLVDLKGLVCRICGMQAFMTGAAIRTFFGPLGAQQQSDKAISVGLELAAGCSACATIQD